MFACCQLCYEKYIDEKDRKLIIYKDDYNKAVDRDLKCHKKDRSRMDYKPVEEACTCECHIYGSNIIH